MLDLKSLIKECDEDQKGTISVYFRMLTKGNLNVCGECECSGFLKEYGITLSGTDSSVTMDTLMDCICLLLAEIDKDYSLIYTTDGGLDLAKKKGFKGTKGSLEESLGLLESVVGGTGSAEEKDDDDDEDFPDRGENDEDDIPTGELEPEPVPVQEPVVKVEEPVVKVAEEPKSEEPKVSEPVTKTTEEPTSKEQEETKEEDKEYSQEDLDSIDSYYNSFIMSTINNLSSAYTDMFQSGYELTSFAGVVTEKGITKLSGQNVKYMQTMQMNQLSSLLRSKMGLEGGSGRVCMERSNTAIANRVYDSYVTAKNSGGSFRPLYFPYKMLEFAYGRMAPSGDDQNALTNYPKHANSNNWKSYCSSEVRQSLSKLLRSCVRKFVTSRTSSKDEWMTPEIDGQIKEYLEYLEMCLSICILVVDWKETISDLGMSSVDAVKVRLCDPYDYVKDDIMPFILETVFSNSTGVDAHSFKPNYPSEGKTHVKEFAHEFNHTKAQAMPLFAYKAAEILNEQGVQVNMENMVLGRDIDDRILKNERLGKVDMSNNLTHVIIAGSRAGKGVMTLNILAAGIASGRPIFYLDRKPDMAALFQHMCPEMFVVNGGALSDVYDIHGHFTNKYKELVENGKLDKYFPDYVKTAFGMESLNVANVGDLTYFRALRFVMSIVLALYTSSECRNNPNLCSKNGIMVVVDEITNLSVGLSGIFGNFSTTMPDKEMISDLLDFKNKKFKDDEVRENKKEELLAKYNKSTNYELIFLNNVSKDLSVMSGSVNAGADTEMRSKMDVFVIGQDIEKRPVDASILIPFGTGKDGRLKGTNGLYLKIQNELASNICYNYTTLQSSFVDAFFGNQEKYDYLKAYSKEVSSKAKGRVDKKARNFAYIPKFSNSEIEKFRGGEKTGKNYAGLSIANDPKTVYFKPFLILNDNSKQYIGELFGTCKENGIDEEVLKAEIYDPNTPNNINDGIGLSGYLKMILPDGYNVYDVLKQSGDIANYVVRDVLGYTDGDWLDFCMDQRLEWMFNMQDLVDALSNAKPKSDIGFFDRSKDSTFSEYFKYLQYIGETKEEEESGEASAKLLTGAYVEGDGAKSESNRAMRQLFASSMPKVEPEEDPDDYPEDDPDDFPDDFPDDPIDLDEDDYDEDDEEDEDDLEDDPEVDPYKTEWERERAKKEIKDDIVEGRQHRGVPNEKPKVSRDSMSAAEKIAEGICSQDELSEIISRLQSLGFTIQYNGNPTTEQPVFASPERNPRYSEPTVYKDDDEDDIRFRKRRTHNKFFSNNRVESRAGRKLDDRFNFSDGESIESFENLVRYITKDVLATFGGRDRVKSFKCKGGSIIINGYVYKCHVGSEMARSLPYDIRARLGASCVASLYDYKSLIGMKGLSKLSFDDINFVYDYVSTTMGYGSRVSVDLFFNDIPSLRELRIGKKVFTRDNYKQRLKGEDRDMFYQPRLLKRTADFTDSFIENRFRDSWALTVDSARNRKYGALRRVGGVVVGSTLTATTGVTSAGVKVVRKGFQSIHRIANSFKDVFKEYDDIRNEDE